MKMARVHAREHAHSHSPSHTRINSRTNTHPRSITYTGFGSEIHVIVRPAQVFCLFCKEVPALLRVHAHVRLFRLKITHPSENGENIEKFRNVVPGPQNRLRSETDLVQISFAPVEIPAKWHLNPSTFLRSLGGNFQAKLSCVTLRV
jgi:hypothetical protein